jgi:hypothetical protein
LYDNISTEGYKVDISNAYTAGTIAVYPEIIRGNPFGAKHVVRWALNVPGYLAGEARYDPSDVVFTWDRKYLDLPDDRILKVNIFEDFIVNKGLDRQGDCFWMGKGSKRGCVVGPEVSGMEEITGAYPKSREELIELLNRKNCLYTYDDCTSLSYEALLCGCRVILLPENREIFLKDVDIKDDYAWELENFISTTQAWV